MFLIKKYSPNFLCLSIFILLLISLSITFAAPPPVVDISGSIIDSSAAGQPPINRSVNISLTNLNTSAKVQGVTNLPDYSNFRISLSGNSSSVLFLKVWNREHESNKTIYLLNGTVQEEITLLLDMNILQNYPPDFISSPITSATENQNYTYSIIATDYNYDAVTLTLVQGPLGMTFNSQTKTLNWVPNQSDVDQGSYNIIISASDGTLTSYQNFTIKVINFNNPPTITSYPSLSAKESSLYTYQVIANDEDNDILSYSITEGPIGLSIDNATGILSWTPNPGEQGDYIVSVVVSDGSSSTSQDWTLFVGPSGNNDPTITSSAPSAAYVDYDYTYQVIANDIDGDTLSYYLPLAPISANIRDDGLVHWTPTENDLTLSPVTFVIRVVDSKGGSATQTSYVTLSNSTPSVPRFSSSNQLTGALLENTGSSSNMTKIPEYIIVDEIKSEETIKNIQSFYELKNASILNLEILFDKENYNKTRIMIKELPRITGISSPQNFIYRYYDIKLENEDDKVVSAKIRFSVPKDFLKKLNITSENIVLLRYHDNAWNKLITRILSEKDETFEYEAITPGFSYFAISVKNATVYPSTTVYKKSPVYDTTGLTKISGKMFTSAKVIQVQRLTRYVITNEETKQEYFGVTGIEDKENSGSYASNIMAKKGDTITIKVYYKNEPIYQKAFVLSSSKEMKLNIYTSIPAEKSQILPIIIVLVISIIILISAKMIYSKKKRFV